MPGVARTVAAAVAGGLFQLFSMEVSAADTCSPAMGRIVVVQGTVEIRRAAHREWVAARPVTGLCDGDAVRTGRRSRAALWLSPENLVRLDQNSLVGLSLTEQETKVEFFPASRASTDPNCGAGYFMSRFPRRFGVKTPYVNASIEGTEFLVTSACTATTLAVYEGKVAVRDLEGLNGVSVSSMEQVSVGPGRPPPVPVRITPEDSVQWAVYYPPLTEARNLSDAESDCVALPAERRRDCRIADSERALRAGDFAAARGGVEAVVRDNPKDPDALALLSVIALVRNDKSAAASLAARAVEADPQSLRGWLASSYAHQATFRLDDALASARRAAEAAPASALAQTQVAEILLALGRSREVVAAAESAVSANPQESRPRTVLGFAHLSRKQSQRAAEAFLSAAAADPADPLPRLGLGLARIRDRRIAEGREEIAIAAALDPTNSLVRSYLGKAYHEENSAERDALAESQFALARQYDPRDPTPHFYDAVRLQASGRLVPAVTALRSAITLNDNRAVYRSRLLLDDDLAARRISLAETYRELGFEQAARVDSALALMTSPANDSAHRNLSDAYAPVDRHEVGRVSELLQAQLLQPVALHNPQPAAAFIDLGVPGGGVMLPTALNEYSSMFDRQGYRLSLSALGGSRDSSGNEVAASVLAGSTFFSLGQFRFASDGFRRNNDIEHEIYNAFVQTAITPEVSIQGEFRRRRSEYGDLVVNFDPAVFEPTERHVLHHDTGRLGFTLTPGPKWRMLGSWFENERKEDSAYAPVIFTLNNADVARGRHGEMQVQYLEHRWNVILGGGMGDVDQRFRALFTDDVFNLFCAAPATSCESTAVRRVEQRNAYAYVNMQLSASLTGTVGLSRDEYFVRPNEVRKWSPKLGVVWSPRPEIRLRAATFRSLKKDLVAEQVIEPTQVAGFNQFFDDFNGTPTETLALGAEVWLTPSLQGTAEYARRELSIVSGLLGVQTVPPQEQHETHGTVFLNWLATPRTSVSVGWRNETYTSDATIQTNWPSFLRTATVPLSIRHALTEAWFVKLTAHDVTQKVERAPPASALPAGSEHFSVVDASLGYRLPKRMGTISLDVYNLFDRSFLYQDDNFRRSHLRPSAYIPDRSVFVRASLRF